MTMQSTYCSQCGYGIDADCDFCPNCGEPKRRPSQTYQNPSHIPHPWMQESAPLLNERPRQSGNLAAAQVMPPATQPVQVHHVVYQQMGGVSGQSQDSGLANAGRTMGIIAISLMAVGLVPCIGWINWFNIPFSFVTLILCIVGASTARTPDVRSKAVIGLVLAIIANVVGVLRLSLGAGCI